MVEAQWSRLNGRGSMVKVERQGSAKAERDEAKARKKSHIQKDVINLNLNYFIY
jgi:hypothetical protein